MRSQTRFAPCLLLSWLGIVAISPEAKADKLTVYVYPSPQGIDWRSPNTLAWSTISNMLVEDDELVAVHPIGHLNFQLTCDPTPAFPAGIRAAIGQTSVSDDEEMSEIFAEGYGLQVFLTPVSGRWETKAEIEADLPTRFRRGSVAFIDYAIKPATCARVVKYLQEYTQKKLDRIYGGLQSRPRHQEGGGCSAFVESVLEIGGLMDPVWTSYFKHKLYVPNELLGGPGTGRSVSFLDLLFGWSSFSWNSSARGSYELTFWDPYYAYYWIEEAYKRPLLTTKFAYKPASIQNARGVAIDATAAPTPTEPFWLN